LAILSGVIFDYSCILLSNPSPTPKLLGRIKGLLTQIKSQGLSFIVFSTHSQPINEKLARFGLPPADLIITQNDVGKAKGSPEWIYETARRLNIEPYQLLIIGDDARDWRSAINSATVYIHAKWATALPNGVTAIATDEPEGIWRFITHYFLNPPRWEYALDVPEFKLHVRSLLGSNVNLPATKTSPPPSKVSFTLQDIFTYNIKAQVGPHNAKDLLMYHAITSLYLEGFISPRSYFAIYPSSTPNKNNPLLEEFLKPVSKIFHGYFKENLLIRAKQAVDSSMEKAAARRQRRKANIPDTNQTNTLHVHPSYKGKLEDRSIIVFDDFTTSGGSLEWARNLLYAAGAREVVLLTIGKYPLDYTIHSTKAGALITPFQLRDYNFESLFSLINISLTRNLAAQQIIKKSFAALLKKEAYPI
jgi:hypothetical protein